MHSPDDVTTATSDELVSISAAAAIAGVHPETIRRWERRGLITAKRTPTGHRRFSRADVDALLSTNEATA